MSADERRNEDGSYSPAEPLGWQHVSGGDWEVYVTESGCKACLYHEELLMEVVHARTRLGLARKMRAANKKHGIASLGATK